VNGIEPLLKGYKEVAATSVTVANGGVVPEKEVENMSFKQTVVTSP
jgi:hypothetical protein